VCRGCQQQRHGQQRSQRSSVLGGEHV
jgi:hypothetical protein